VLTLTASKLKLFLEKNAINGEDIPVEYDLNITNMEVTNTYVFTEQDLPGYESKMETGVKEGDPAIPARFLYQNRQREQAKNDGASTTGSSDGGGGSGGGHGKNWKNNRYQPYFRKAIPKRTALVGTAKHECAVLPVFNDEYRDFQMKRTVREDAPKFSTKYLDNSTLASNLLQPGTTGIMQTSFSRFVVSFIQLFI
jgi:transcription initiation factor TFIIF subunit beta